MTTTSEAIIDRLLEWGVDTYYGLPGDGINGFYEALRRRRDSVRLIHVRHEEEAALAAVGHARFTGKPAVVVTTSGPGATHILNGLYDATVEGAPLIAITGMQFHDMLGTHYLQDVNHHYAFDNACVFNQQVNSGAHALNMVDLAYRSAVSRRGAAHLAIPVDVQDWDVDLVPRSGKNVTGHNGTTLGASGVRPAEADLDRAVELFAAANRPVIVAGQGARGAHAELERVADLLGAPVVKPALGKDVLGDESPFVLGGTGFAGTTASQLALEECDAMLIVGSSSGYADFWAQPGQARAVQIDVDGSRIGLRYPAEIGLVGDARATLADLAQRLTRRSDRSFLERCQENLARWWAYEDGQARSEQKPIRPQVVTGALGDLLADDAIVCGDAGTVTVWQGRMRMRTGQKFAFSGTNCTMAAAVPYAIGAQAAHPGRQVVAFQGDGSAAMLMGSLATLAQNRLPVTVVVMNNSELGLITWEQLAYLGNPESSTELSRIDFAAVAQGCGVRGFHVENPGEVREALAAALAHDGPALVDCWIDPDVSPFAETMKDFHARNLADALGPDQPRSRQKAERLLEPEVQAIANHLGTVHDELESKSR